MKKFAPDYLASFITNQTNTQFNLPNSDDTSNTCARTSYTFACQT